MAGKFITLEGIDGSGKSTQSQKISQWLESFTGLKTVRTFEPGGWPDGERLREFILSSKNFSSMSELLLFLADRAEHVSRLILPSLADGFNVVCERWNESTLAYQSGGHGLEVSVIERIIGACEFPEPYAKIFLDVPPEIAFERVRLRNNHSDKFEAEGLSLMRKVSDSYRLMSDRFIHIDCGEMSEDEIFWAIVERLEAKIHGDSD
ncbi:MAG: dTMP kinase [Synergistaceae bacterium]|nr:dTMP kinase [Synergistaceae bacterium]